MRTSRVMYAVAAGVVALVLPTVPTADAAPNQHRLAHYQHQFLDPQTDKSLADRPPTHDQHHGSHATADGTVHASGFTTLPPEEGGQWDYLPSFPPQFNALHVVAGPNGKILLIAGSGRNKNNFAAGTFTSYLWDPATDERRKIATPSDMFCAGHVLLPDGRALVGGGTIAYGDGKTTAWRGAPDLYAFDFEREVYDELTPLEVGRWYPTAVTGSDGRVLFVAGFDENGLKTNVTEVFDPATDTHSRVRSTLNLPNYVHLHLSADDRFFVANTTRPGFWDPYADRFTRVVGPVGTNYTVGTQASCFVGDVRDQNLMIMGGGWPATNVTRVIDLDAPTPTYATGPPLPAAKAYLSCVNLPDGTLFEANGGTSNTVSGASNEASILTTLEQGWTPVNPLPAGEHRLYHSLLYLLDSGQVVSTTSNPNGQARNNSLLVYSPPYLFRGARPQITQAPSEVVYGGTYPVAATADGATVDRFTITAAPSPTHSLDPNQRYVSLPVVDGTITLPTSGAILPPGWYRLWAVDTQGRPSTAIWIHLS